MTHESRYRIAGNPYNTQESLTLFEACMALASLANEDKLTDATHIRESDRCVAFFSEYRRCLRPMFQAHPSEVTSIGNGWAHKFN